MSCDTAGLHEALRPCTTRLDSTARGDGEGLASGRERRSSPFSPSGRLRSAGQDRGARRGRAGLTDELWIARSASLSSRRGRDASGEDESAGSDLQVGTQLPLHGQRHQRSTRQSTTRADHTHRPTECLPLPANVVASAVAVEVTVVDRVAVPVAVLARTRRRSGKHSRPSSVLRFAGM